MAGYDRSQVISLYERAKVYVDTYLTGMERGVFESCLFNVVPIVAHNGQAQDMADFPIPNRWRWQPWDYEELSAIIQRALERHDEAVADMAPLREYVRRMPTTFLEQVRVFYGDHVHFVTSTTSRPLEGFPSRLARSATAASLAWLTLGYPFATSEALTDNAFYLQYDYTGVFRALQVRSHSRTVAVSEIAAEFGRLINVPAQYLQSPQHQHYSRWVMILPTGVVPLAPGYVTHLSDIVRSKKLTLLMDPTPHGPILLVERTLYYPAVAQLMLVLDPEVSFPEFVHLVCEVQGMHCAETVAAVPAMPATGPASAQCAVLAFKGRPPHASCCSSVREVVHHKLFRYALATLQEDDPLTGWLAGLTQHCRA